MSNPDLVRDITDFRRKFPWNGEFYEGKPRLLPTDQMSFWMRFIEEEKDEWDKNSTILAAFFEQGYPENAVVTHHLAEMLDAGVDIIYVVMGVLQRQGLLPMFYDAWNRVHEANMAKECANGDASKSLRGNPWDVIKPPGWTAPDHTDLVQDHAHQLCEDEGCPQAGTPHVCVDK